MAKKYLLGIDIGTSSSKGVIIDENANVVQSDRIQHGVRTPKPGWAEHEADEIWWGDFKKLSNRLLKSSGIPPEQITSVGVSALHAAMLPLDEGGNPIRPAVLYGVDTRSTEEIEILNERIGEDRIYEVSGNSLTLQSVGPKILWYKRNEPKNFEQTDKIVDATGYTVYKLTNNYTIDNAIAGFFDPLFNLSDVEWEDEMFSELGIPKDLLPKNKWSTEIAGHVTENASVETGLAEGTPVIVGTGDAIASQVSVGAVEDGDSIFMYGTTGVIYTTLDEERTTPSLWAFPHCLEGKYAMAGGMATSGAILEWFRDEFGGEDIENRGVGKKSFRTLNERARQIDPGSDGLVLLPYFSGERTPMNDDSARGMLSGLTLSHTKSHVYRAILEGIGYGFRHHLDAMNEAGVPINRVLAIGGGAQSTLWRQIVSDITGVTQQYVSKPLGSPLGVAYLAGLGVGTFSDLDDITESTDVIEETVPDLEVKERYNEYYSVYRKLYPETKGSMHKLSELDKR